MYSDEMLSSSLKFKNSCAAFVHLEFMRRIGRWGGPGAEGAVAKALRLGAGAGHGREGKSRQSFFWLFS